MNKSDSSLLDTVKMQERVDLYSEEQPESDVIEVEDESYWVQRRRSSGPVTHVEIKEAANLGKDRSNEISESFKRELQNPPEEEKKQSPADKARPAGEGVHQNPTFERDVQLLPDQRLR